MVNPKGGPPVTVAAIDARKSNQEKHATREVLSTTQQIGVRAMIAGAYLRKSDVDERSAEDGKSIERQRESAVAYAAKKGWHLDPTSIFADDDVSGGEFKKRPGLTRLLGALESTPAFAALIVMDQSRLGRDTIRTLSLVQAIQDAGVEIRSYLDDREITVDGESDEVETFMRSWADSKARRDARTRTRDALVRKARHGHATGQRTYGYALERRGEHTERVIDASQAAVVRRVFTMSAEGHGDLRIVNRLNSEKIAAPGPKGWSKDIIRTMLRNELYRGVAIYGKTRTVAKGGHASHRDPAPTGEWVRTEVPQLRVIDDALWDRVQLRKAKTRAHYLRHADGTLAGKPEAGLTAQHLLNGIGRCGVCGGALLFSAKNPTTRRYYCSTRLHRGACDNNKGVPAPALDRLVQEKVHTLLTEEVAEILYERAVKADQEFKAALDGRSEERERVRREITHLEQAIARLTDAIEQGQPVGDRLKQRQGELEGLRAKVVASPPARLSKAEIAGHLAKIRRAGHIIDGDPVGVREVMRKMGIDHITVTPQDGGWTVDGLADLSRLVLGTKGGPAPSERPPRIGCATTAGARTRTIHRSALFQAGRVPRTGS
jgi:site-specific DNA recombinase